MGLQQVTWIYTKLLKMMKLPYILVSVGENILVKSSVFHSVGPLLLSGGRHRCLKRGSKWAKALENLYWNQNMTPILVQGILNSKWALIVGYVLFLEVWRPTTLSPRMETFKSTPKHKVFENIPHFKYGWTSSCWKFPNFLGHFELLAGYL